MPSRNRFFRRLLSGPAGIAVSGLVAGLALSLAGATRADAGAGMDGGARPGTQAGAAATIGDALPARLSETGLFRDGDPARVDPAHLAYSPQYPLWTDGAGKQRWLSLPAGRTIDARDPNAWQFPPGTRLWKTFGYQQPVETRMIERLANGQWRYATYLWREDGSDADLAPAGGRELALADAPTGRYRLPSREDCTACHEGTRTPVLGFSALQLSPERDPSAPAAGPGNVDLGDLAGRGLLAGLPAALLRQPPRIPARSAEERATLGYLHGNCGHCHNRSGRGVPVPLSLAALWQGEGIDADSIRASLVGREARYAGAGLPHRLVAPGDVAASLLPARMRSREPRLRMPPLGTQSVDEQGLALVDHWIATMPSSPPPSAQEPAR
ncbi:MAG TPA: hypothetical protein VK016_02075 [Arenimonas sp.]|nr:hypothetical protein [Arenimonas sp.]